MSRKFKMVDECHGCGYGPIEASPCTAPHRANLAEPSVMLCRVCQESTIGNNALYDLAGYREHGVVLRAIGACTNMILAAIRKE